MYPMICCVLFEYHRHIVWGTRYNVVSPRSRGISRDSGTGLVGKEVLEAILASPGLLPRFSYIIPQPCSPMPPTTISTLNLYGLPYSNMDGIAYIQTHKEPEPSNPHCSYASRERTDPGRWPDHPRAVMPRDKVVATREPSLFRSRATSSMSDKTANRLSRQRCHSFRWHCRARRQR